MTKVIFVGEMYYSDLGIGGGPIFPGPGEPTHPIAPGGPPPYPSHPIPPGVWPNPPGQPGQPPGFWGGINPHPDQGLPGQPPGFWGGRPPNWIDNTLPGQPPGIWGGPGSLPNYPMPPIYYPPGAPGRPPGAVSGGPGSLPPWVMPPIALPPPPGSPPGIWGGPPAWVDNTLPPDQPVAGWPPTIMPPIFYPPNVPPVDPPPPDQKVEWHTGWTPDKGWVVVGIVTPEAPHPAPSK